jgi:hypothetical protein
MQFVIELWQPILFSGLAVFVLSALVWTVLPHHKKEWQQLPNESAVLSAIRAGNPSPGLYSIPYASDMKELGTPEMVAKMESGPVGYLTIAPNGTPKMGPMMAKSILYNIGVSFFVAYVAYHALAPGASYREVYRITGTVAFAAYAFGNVSDSIWFAKPWKSWTLHAFDSMMYALVIGGFFGWLWP